MMDFSLTNEQVELKKEIIAFAETHLNENVEERDQQQYFDRELWKKSGEIKLPGLCIPKEYGGRGLGAVSTVIALETLGYACDDGGFNFAISAHLLACLVPIWLHGSEEQKEKILPDLCNGNLIAGNAMTESSAGSNAFEMSTTAKETENGFQLHGTKSFVSNGPVADVLVSYALTAPEKGFFGGISALILEKKDHPYIALKKMDKLGIRTCLLSEIQFDNLSIGKETLLGKEGGGGMIFTQSMDWERICLGAIHIGAMDKLMKEIVKYHRKNKVKGSPTKSSQANAHIVADLKASLEAARLLLYNAAWKLDQGLRVNMEGSLVKLFVSETFKKFALKMNELYLHTNFNGRDKLERALRDSIAGTVYSGTSEIHRNIIAQRMGMY